MRNKLLIFLAVLMTAFTAKAENYILYTSSDGQVVTPEETYLDVIEDETYFEDYEEESIEKLVFGAKIVSNSYRNGQGKILFDGEITELGNYAFNNCTTLKSIVIPGSVKSIGYSAFTNCI